MHTADEVAAGEDLDAFFAQFDTDDDATATAARHAAPEPVSRRPDLPRRGAARGVPRHARTPRPSRAGSAGRSARRTASPNSPRRPTCGSGWRSCRRTTCSTAGSWSELKLATNTAVGNAQLRAAREGKGVNDTTWPEAHYLGPLHPVLDWASDRALTALGRNQVFVIRGDVDAPTVLLMGTLTNKRGQLISRVFSTAVFPNPANTDFCLVEPLEDLGFLTEQTGAATRLVEPRPGRRSRALPGPHPDRRRARPPRDALGARRAGGRHHRTARAAGGSERSAGTPTPTPSTCAVRSARASAASVSASTRSSASPTCWRRPSSWCARCSSWWPPIPPSPERTSDRALLRFHRRRRGLDQ